MTIDPRYAYLEDDKGNRYQVLKPREYGARVKLDADGYPIPVMEGDDAVLGPDGNPLFETERYELPREWDEVATVKAMEAAHD